MLKFYNTLTRELEEFKPQKEGEVAMYTCGPTVYNFVHIGNLRAYAFADLLKRYLDYVGYHINHVMNITDIDDKTIKGAQKQNKPLSDFTAFYEEAFLKDLESLNIKKADAMPNATEHIKQMVDLIKILKDKGYAYEADGSIYFKISKFSDYGRLAQLERQNLKEGASCRVDNDEYEKEDLNDFVLWKGWRPEDGEVYWETEIGKGRPGWHIECSAMSMEYLGETIDIHTGGSDLIFPHHSNEIAQSEAATGKYFVKYWLHNAHLMVEGQKMSKSLGNFYTLRDIVEKGYHPLVLKLVLLKTHYRQILDFKFSNLEESRNIIKSFAEFLMDIDSIEAVEQNDLDVDGLIDKSRSVFEEAMDNDLNISEALSALFWITAEINKSKNLINKNQAQKIKDYVLEIDSVLGFIKPAYLGYQSKLSELLKVSDIQQLLEKRQQARESKDFQLADKIRDELLLKNIAIEDGEGGQKTRLAEGFL